MGFMMRAMLEVRDPAISVPVKPRHLPIPAVARTAEPAAIRRGRRVGSPILKSDQLGKPS